MFEMVRIVSYILRISRHLRHSREKVMISILTGLLSGIGYISMLAVINSALRPGGKGNLPLAFIALCVLVPASRLISQALLNAISTDAVFEMRLLLCRKLLATPLRTLEELGSNRLLACLTEDVNSISSALVLVPVVFMHIAIISTSLGYMGWLSWRLLLIVLAFMGFGVLTYGIPLRLAGRYIHAMREETDTLFAHFRGLIHGSKELKLHRRRRESFVTSAVAPTADAIRKSGFLGQTIYTATSVWGNILFFIAIGLLVFLWAGRWHLESQVLSGYTLALLYIVTPLEILFQSLPVLGRAAVAIAKLEQLGVELGAAPVEPAAPATPEEAPGDIEARAKSWRHLELAGVRYTYHPPAGDPDAEPFTIGPFHLEFRSGETIFIIGGNGSGKSTLAKVLTGLYTPDAGDIRLDGESITDRNRDDYRQMFSAVFSDPFLLQTLLGLDDDAIARYGELYLDRLHLTSKVKIRNGELSTVDLSQGQRKRLALLIAYLEDRSIYFFDEWAADQDPQYKATFYREILPELKARGKTVFVISHDDQYYEFGDRLLKLDYGQVQSDRRVGARAEATLAPARAASASGLDEDRRALASFPVLVAENLVVVAGKGHVEVGDHVVLRGISEEHLDAPVQPGILVGADVTQAVPEEGQAVLEARPLDVLP
jgi:putative pyoverdin transport system ATP-binding/permease protein